MGVPPPHPTTIPCRRGRRRSQGRHATHEVWSAGILARIVRHHTNPTPPPMPARATTLPGKARATRGLVRGHPCPHCPSSHHPTHNPMPARAPALPGKARATRGLVRGHPCPQCPSSHHPTHHNPVPARATALPGKARATPGLVRGHPCPCVPTKSPDGCIGCRVTRQRGTLPHGFTTPATPRSPLAPAGVRHTA